MEKIIEVLKKEKFIFLLLLLVCAVLLFYKLGSYSLIDVDEPRYAEAAREMLHSGNWITPYFNFELRFDKPVLTYWFIAMSYITFGVTEFAARFPSALTAFCLVLFTYFIGKKVVSKSFGIISAFILVSSLEFIAISRMSMTDMILTFFICGTLIAGFWASVSVNNKKYWWWFAYLLSGFAVLTKGPVGFLLPALVFGIYFILTGQLKKNLKLSYIIPGVLIFSAIALPWYYFVIKANGMDFVNAFFLKHNLARFSSSHFGQHEQPFYFYMIVIPAGFFPWTFFGLAALINKIKEIFLYIRQSLSSGKIAIFENADLKLKFTLYLLIWFLVIFCFFSASKAKLLTYVLPVFPALAMLTAFLWDEYIQENKNKLGIKLGLIIFIILGFALDFVLLFCLNFVLPKDVKLTAFHPGVLTLVLFTLIPFAAMILYKKKEITFACVVLFMMTALYTAANSILPIVSNSGPSDLVKYALLYKNTVNVNKEMLSYRLLKPSIVFYSQSKIYFTDVKNEVDKTLNSEKQVFVIIRNKDAAEFQSNRYKLIDKGIRYSLISNK